jgi:hypothetical protein
MPSFQYCRTGGDDHASPTIRPDGGANDAALEYPSPSSNKFANEREAVAHASLMHLDSLERSQHLSLVPA